MKTTAKSTFVILLGIAAVSFSAFVLYAENKTRQESDGKDIAILAPSSFWIGIQVAPVPDVLLSHFGVKEGENGGRILVEQIVPDGPAAKAGLKRGDVILKFADKEINSLHDLVTQVAEVKETAKPIQIVRAGEKMELTVTPTPRPAESLTFQGDPRFQTRPMSPQQMISPPGTRLGPEVWIGPRDPQKMMREMEEYFRQMQGGADGDQLLIQPNDPSAKTPNGISGKQLSVSSMTDKDGKTKIKVKQVITSGNSTDEKIWETEKIDDLPEEIRGDIKIMLPDMP